MTGLRPTPPEPRDLLSEDQVRAVIAKTDRELSTLEASATAAREAAEAAECAARDIGLDERSSTWTMVQLQHFLDGLREEVDRDTSAVVAMAEERAKHRLEHANAIARGGNVRGPAALPVIEDRPVALTREPSPVVVVPTVNAEPPAPVDAVVPGPVAEPVAPVMTEARPETSAAPPVSVSAPPTDESSVQAPPAPVVNHVAAVPPAAVFAAPTPAPAAPMQPSSTQAPASPAKRRRIPWSAVLEVVAVLLVLLFILLRLS